LKIQKEREEQRKIEDMKRQKKREQEDENLKKKLSLVL
tara:strand:- start:937 stop:1050 length:114 start_codon:yes stop_codon:yes gene_type:complete